ncbi:MAG: hypothetical protein MJ185_02120 [Treponema sp.]|nr:hypothetical protein [Treponema sp.]
MNTSLLKKKFSLKDFSSFFCFITIVVGIIDPSNQLLHIKDISFILFVLLSLPYISFENYFFSLFLFTMFFYSYSFQFLFPDAVVDSSYVMHTLKGFIYTIIILWMNKDTHLNVFKYFYFGVFLLSLLIFFLWCLLKIFPNLIPVFRIFFNKRTNIAVTTRNFLGRELFAVNCGTGVLSTICLSYSQYEVLFENKKRKVFDSFLFSMCLFCSGTRANILSMLMILGVSILLFIYKNKYFSIFSFLFTVGMFLFILLVIKFLSDKGEYSLNIKTLHLKSYNELFNLNPIRYVFWGDGPGALFFTKGFNMYVAQTEWTYLDLIRNYGFFNTIVIFMFYLVPLVDIYNNYNIYFCILLTIGYLLFIIISGTNPYLINSVGFTVLAVIIYISKNKFISKEA